MRSTDPGDISPYLQPPVAPVPYYPPPDAIVGNAGGGLGGQWSGVMPPPIPTPADGGGGGGGTTLAQVIHAMRSGYTPDYQALLASDPEFLQAQADVRGQLGTAAASRKAATARILTQLGIVPDFASALNALGLNSSYLGEDVDPTIAGLAQQMTQQGLSTEAQLNRQHDVGVNSLVDALAARGTLRSGGLGVGMTQENERDKTAHFDALRAALDAIGGAQGGYNQTVQGTTDTLRTAADQAVQRQIQLHPAVAGGQVDATYDAATGLYKDSDGNLYNADGTPTRVGAANASPVHPSNVAPPTESATTAAFPQAAAQTAVALPHVNISAAPPLVSENGKWTAAPTPVPGLASLGDGRPASAVRPAPVPVPQPYGNPVIDDALRGLPTGQVGSDPSLAVGSWVGVPKEATPRPVPRPTAWTNSVTKRLNMGF